MADQRFVYADGSTVSVPERYLSQYLAANTTSYQPPAYTREYIKENPNYNYVRYNGRVVKESELPSKVRKNIRRAVNPIELYKMGIEADPQNFAYRVQVKQDAGIATGVSPWIKQQYDKFLSTGDVRYINRILSFKMWQEGARSAFRERERFIGLGIKHTSLTGMYGGGIYGKIIKPVQGNVLETGMKQLRSEWNEARSNVSRTDTIFSGGETIRRNNEVIKTSSEEGKQIERQYWWQQRAREINAAQRELFWAVTRAPSAQQAMIEKYTRTQGNPNLGTFQLYYNKGYLVGSEGTLGIGDTPITINGKEYGAAPEGYIGFLKGSIASQQSQNLYNAKGERIARDIKQTGGFSFYTTPPKTEESVYGPPAPYWTVENLNPRTRDKHPTLTFKTEEAAQNYIRKTTKEFAGPIGSLAFTFGQKPLSSSGERIEFGIKWISERQQELAGKKGDDVRLVSNALEFGKEFLSGAAYLENAFWAGEASIRKGTVIEDIQKNANMISSMISGRKIEPTFDTGVKTRQIEIPETYGMTLMQGGFERKPLPVIYEDLKKYESKYGSAAIGGLAAFAIPLPGAKIPKLNILSTARRIPQINQLAIRTNNIATKVSETVKIPQMRNLIARVSEKIELSGDVRMIRKIEREMIPKGVPYKIEKKGQYVFVYGGLEGKPTFVKPEIQRKLSGFTRDVNDKYSPIIPRYSKVPTQIVVPLAKEGVDYSKSFVRVYTRKARLREGVQISDLAKPSKKLAEIRTARKPASMKVKEILMFRKTIRKVGEYNFKKYVKTPYYAVKGAPKQIKYLASKENIKKTVRSAFPTKVKQSKIRKGIIVEQIAHPSEISQRGITNKLVYTTADIGGIEATAKTTRLAKINRTTLGTFKPSKSLQEEFAKLTKEGQVDLFAVGKSMPFDLLKKAYAGKSVLSRIKEGIRKPKNTKIARQTEKTIVPKIRFKPSKFSRKATLPKTVSEMIRMKRISQIKKLGGIVAKKERKEKTMFDFMGKKSQETLYYESRGGGIQGTGEYLENIGRRFRPGKVSFKNDRLKQSLIPRYSGKNPDKYISVGATNKIVSESLADPKKLENINKALKKAGMKEITIDELKAQESVVSKRVQDWSKTTPMRFEKEKEKAMTGKAMTLLKQVKGTLPRMTQTGFKDRTGRNALYRPSGIVTITKEKTDYLQTKSRYEPSALLKSNRQISGIADEESFLLAPKELQRLSSRGLQRRDLRMKQESQLYRVNTDMLIRENIREKPERKLRIKAIITPKIKQKEILVPRQTPIIGQKQRQTPIQGITQVPKLKPKTEQVPKLKTRIDEIPKTPTRQRPRLLYSAFSSLKISRQKKKSRQENAADFLGASSESSVFGLTKRAEITYGRERTARLSARDLRKRTMVTSGTNPENVRLVKRRKKPSKDIYREGAGSFKTTKKNIFGKRSKRIAL